MTRLLRQAQNQKVILNSESGSIYLFFPVQDRNIPSSNQTGINFICEMDVWLRAGKNVVGSYPQGIGHVSMMAAVMALNDEAFA
jgi:hypothetical protein